MHRGGRVAVTIYLSGNMDGVISFLESNDVSPRNVGEDYIEAYIPVLLVPETSDQPGVLRVRIAFPGESFQGSTSTGGNGPDVHGSPAWNEAGYGGQGIRVGIIDDGFERLSGLLGTELPSTVTARCLPSDSDVATSVVSDCEWYSVHGTAVAEAVMDIAPEASLYIANVVTEGDLQAAVSWMIDQGVDVINHSMGWNFDGPGDGTSPYSRSPLRSVARAVDGAIVWVNAAGNDAERTWFRRSPSYTTIRVDGEDVKVVVFYEIYVGIGFNANSLLQLRWEDDWQRAGSDLALYILQNPEDSRRILTKISNSQEGQAGDIPLELFIGEGVGTVLVAHIGGEEPEWVQLVAWGGLGLPTESSGPGSIANPAESANPGMLAVGAAHWNDVNNIEGFSSRGPTPDGRTKPDIVGADCGESVTYSEMDSRPGCWFSGTSQATPHVAGLAALVRQRFPDYTPAQVVSYLKDNAQQRGTPDPNNTWGHGFIVLPPNPPQIFGSPTIDSVTAGVNSLTVLWSAPTANGGSTITAYDLRHIETAADENVDANWTLAEDVWTSGSGALSYELTGLQAGTQYNVQVRAVNSNGDGPWSTTVAGTPTIAETPCSTGSAVPNPRNNQALVADCDTLLAIRDTLAGSGTLNWSASTPITDWDGVAAVEGTPQHVTVLYLPNQGLSGTLPPELGELNGLEQLTLLNNELTGAIPPELADLSRLNQIILGGNQLTGVIPPELGGLASLQGLELYENNLTGTIPSELGSLTNLQALHIDTNRLSGPIPPELGSLTNLRWLTLHDNQLTGEIPSTLGRLTNLEQLYLSGNRFSDCVPSELRNVRETDRTHRLREIGIPYCDVLLRGLSITPAELRPEFDPYVTGYTAAATASSVTVVPTSRHNATFQYLDRNDEVLADADVTQAGHQVEVPVGMVTTIRVKVTTGDGTDSRTYTIEVTGLGGLASPSIRQVTSGVDSLSVSWRAPTQTSGSEITAYDLRHIRSDAPSKVDPAWTVIQDVWGGSGALSHELTGLGGGVQYDIQVRAVNDTGDGPWSATVTGKPRGTVPGAPTGLTATANGQTQVDLAWSAPLEDGGTTVTGYRIEVSLNGSSWNDLVSDSRSTATTYSHTELAAVSTRHYRVSAINSEGTGPASNVANATTDAATAPDLVVDTPTVDTSAPVSGASFTLNATVRNQGNGPSGFVWLHYYESTDSNITSGDRLLATSGIAGLLAPSESRDEQHSLAAPSTPGTYYYGACVDAVAGETDTTNNCSAAVTVTVGAAPAPDLVVNTPTVSDSAPTAGARFTLNVTVRNQGNGQSAFTTLRYYRSTDSTIGTGDTQVGTDSVFRLGASASGDEWTSLTAPSTPGAYYYGACVDPVSDESDTTNNCSSAVTVTVGAAPVPDLVVNKPAVSDSTPTAGARFTLNATVRNQGNGRSDSTTLRYYRSTDSTITTGDTEVGTDYVSRLDASESGDESVGLTAQSAAGTYYFGACVDAVSDETNTTNNCSSAVTVTVGAPPAPDLVVDRPTVSSSAPTAGARITLTAAVLNQGDGRSDSTTLRYYQSTDPTITTDDTEVGTDSVFRLSASSSGNESISLAAPSTPGTYYYGACVDPVSDESDTTNNCSPVVAVTVGAAPAPDLVMDTPTVSESAPVPGARIILSATVRNQGNGASAFTTLRYYRSTDATITTSDTSVGTDSVSRLNASGSSPESISLNAPFTARTYHYGACVDSVTSESDTTNNCSAAVTVTVGAVASVPGAPTRLVATANGQTRIDLSWAAPSNDGGATITGYKVESSANGSSWSDLVTDTNSITTSYSHTGLTAGTTQHYRVSAINPTGTGPTSSVVGTATDSQVGTGDCATGGAVPDVANNPGLVADCDTLLVVKDTLRGAATLNWSSNAPMTHWVGITVGGTPLRVTELFISRSVVTGRLTGVIPSELGNLANLKTLNLSENRLTGTIPPELGNLANLETLNLWDNQLTGSVPVQLGDLSNLRFLILNNNQLSGGMPTELGELGNLEILNLRHNQLSGAIPSELSGLTSLTRLDLLDNQLTGGIPYQLGSIRSLERLELNGNQITGSIPSELGNLANLTLLELNHNRLSGEIPAELGHLTNLTLLSLNNNQLTGSIPPELGNLAKLQHLNLAGNELTGCIPASLLRVQFTDFASLGLLDCAESPDTDATCATGGAVPDAAGNPDLVSDCDSLLAARVTLRGTATLNWSHSTDIENWEGVTLSGAPKRVTKLSIPRRGLLGTIPPELGDLTGLTELILSDNHLTDGIPPELGSLASLERLMLPNNNLTGEIPPELADLSNLTWLWLNSNQLSGKIPPELGDLANLSALNLGWNQLSGDIPSELGNLRKLQRLTLTVNQLSGCVPRSLKDQLESFLFDRNIDFCVSQTTPSVPLHLAATADGQTEIDLSWSVPSDDGGAAITGYRIEVSTDGSSWSDLVADSDSTSTSCSHTGLTAGSTRYYRVSAINSVGTGSASNSDSATTEAEPATKPDAPRNLTATADGQTEIDLSWTAPSDDGGAAITGYRIEVSTDGSSWSNLVADSDSTSTSYSHKGLTAGSTRYYRVSAINSVGIGPASNADAATTDEEPASDGTCTVDLIVGLGESCIYPGTPTQFSVDSNGRGSFLFTSSGTKIEIRNSTINGVTYTFVASKQSSGSWLIEEVG